MYGYADAKPEWLATFVAIARGVADELHAAGDEFGEALQGESAYELGRRLDEALDSLDEDAEAMQMGLEIMQGTSPSSEVWHLHRRLQRREARDRAKEIANGDWWTKHGEEADREAARLAGEERAQ